MEGTILGVPSIALSQEYPVGGKVPWATAETLAPDPIRRLCAIGWPRNTLVNVNFPAVAPDQVTGVRACTQGRRKIGDQIVVGEEPRGAPYHWIGSTRTERKSTRLNPSD